MSNIVTNLVKALDWEKLSQKRLPNANYILFVIADRADDSGYTWIEQEHLSKVTQLSERTVRHWLGWLEKVGLISRRYRFGKDGKRIADGITILIATVSKLLIATVSKLQKNAPSASIELPAAVAGSYEATGNSLQSYRRQLPVHIEETSKDTSIKEIYKENCFFEEFWSAFDYSRGKKKCLEIWKRDGLDENSDKIISRAKQHATSRFGEEKFWTWPKTWLNDEGWNDELPGMKSSKPITAETLALIEAGKKRLENKISLPSNHFMNKFKRGEFNDPNVRH